MEKLWSCESDILCGVNNEKESFDLGRLELEHKPVIVAPGRVKRNEVFQIRVNVGEHYIHQSKPEHFIEWLEVYAGDTFLGRVHFAAGVSYPEVILSATLAHAVGPLRAWVKCNQHGSWSATKSIAVE